MQRRNFILSNSTAFLSHIFYGVCNEPKFRELPISFFKIKLVTKRGIWILTLCRLFQLKCKNTVLEEKGRNFRLASYRIYAATEHRCPADPGAVLTASLFWEVTCLPRRPEDPKPRMPNHLHCRHGAFPVLIPPLEHRCTHTAFGSLSVSGLC